MYGSEFEEGYTDTVHPLAWLQNAKPFRRRPGSPTWPLRRRAKVPKNRRGRVRVVLLKAGHVARQYANGKGNFRPCRCGHVEQHANKLGVPVAVEHSVLLRQQSTDLP